MPPDLIFAVVFFSLLAIDNLPLLSVALALARVFGPLFCPRQGKSARRHVDPPAAGSAQGSLV